MFKVILNFLTGCKIAKIHFTLKFKSQAMISLYKEMITFRILMVPDDWEGGGGRCGFFPCRMKI